MGDEDFFETQEQPMSVQEVEESDFIGDALDFNRNFSRNSARYEETEEVPSQLDLEHVRQLLKAGKLTDSAKYLGRFPNQTEHLVEALNLTALHAFVGKHYRAADVLWKRAYSLAPEMPNILFNYGRLLFSMGRNDQAIELLNRFNRQKPNFSPAKAILKQLEA